MRTWQHEPSSLKREKIKEKTGERVPRRTMDYQRHWEAAEAWPTTALPDGSAKGHVKGILWCDVIRKIVSPDSQSTQNLFLVLLRLSI